MKNEYLEHVSTEITEEIEAFTTDIVFLESRYLFTFKKDKVEYGYCTHCKSEFKINDLKHNSKHYCPCCGSECTVKNSWRGHKYLQDEACFIYFEKSIKDSNVLVAKGYYARRSYGGDYRNVYNQYALEAIYLFNLSTNKAKMFKDQYWRHEFRETSSIYSFNINGLARHPFYCSNKSIEHAVKDTEFKYFPYQEFLGQNMIKVFDLYTKYPVIEQLVKVEMKSLILSRLNKVDMHNSVNWRGKDVFKIMRINRKDLKDIRESKLSVTPKFLKLYQLSRKEKSGLTPSNIKALEIIISYNTDRFNNILKYTTMKKAYKYMKKQLEIKRTNKYFSIVSTWDDYISDCIKLKMDLAFENVLFPKNIEAAHQNTIKQVKVKEDEQLNMAIAKRLNTLDKYSFELNGLLIRPAKDSIELLEEGKKLSHCVGTYSNKYAEGKTNIFVIRKIDEVDKPFYTLEFFNDSIIQVRGNRNCSPTKEVEAFVEAFKEAKLKNKKTKVKISA